MGTKQTVMNTDTISNDDRSRSSGEIAADIRETRSRMDSTLDELGNRLTPRSLLNSAFDWWESPDSGNQGTAAARKAVITLARQARSHPMPALLIGSGIAWLISEAVGHEDGPVRYRADNGSRPSPNEGGLMDDAKHTAKETYDTVKEKALVIGDKLHEKTDHLSQQAHHAMDQGKTTVLKLKNEVKEGYHMGTERFGRACDDYPLAVGLAFAALGALAGLVIPRTRQEDKWMGDRSDQLVQETKEKAEDLLETGKAVGNRVLQTVKEEVEEQGLTPAAVAEKISELAESGGHIVQKAKQQALQASKDEGLTPAPRPEP
jgi:hypothetical protein